MPFTYAIADLHGRYDLLSEAVTRIVEHSKSDRPATVITLGDYVDRGPKSRQVIERLMDWRLPEYGERHLRRVLSLYSLYYNETRTRLGLAMDAPLRRAVQRSGTIVTTPILSGLQHRYARI